MQDMPPGPFTRRREETGFKRESSVKMATKWLEWEAHQRQRGISIRHENNSIEKRVGDRQLPVDGFHGPTQPVFQYHGCFWYGHDCYLNDGKEFNAKRKKSMSELREETEANSKYIEAQGYKLVQIWECQRLHMTRTSLAVSQFLQSKFYRRMDSYWNPSQKKICPPLKIIICLVLSSATFVYLIISNPSFTKCVLFSRTRKLQEMTLASL